MWHSSDDRGFHRWTPRLGNLPLSNGNTHLETGINLSRSRASDPALDRPSKSAISPIGADDATGAPDYRETIDDVTLPDPVDTLAAEYDDVFGERDRFLWRWIYSLLPEFTLSSVTDEYAEPVRIRKTLLTLFVTLLDDLAEKHGDAPTFEEIRRSVCFPDAPRTDRPGVDTEVVSLAERIWAAVETSLDSAPRHDRYREVFEYDLRQTLNAMDYARLVNERLSMANLAGAGHYGPHNMVMFPYADLDLMYSPAFDPDELGIVRELIWDLQKMARIGNWLTTWERELHEGDCTAGVIVYALRQDVVSVDDVESPDPERRAAAAERIKNHGIEDRFADEWWRLYDSVVDHGLEAESVDLDGLVSGMETVMAHHTASRGHK